MTEEQHEHLNKIRESIALRLEQKYTAGQKEHGGNLWDMPEEGLLDQAIDEAIDQLTYLYTLQDKMHERVGKELGLA